MRRKLCGGSESWRDGACGCEYEFGLVIEAVLTGKGVEYGGSGMLVH